MEKNLQKVRIASDNMILLSSDQKEELLKDLAKELIKNSDLILSENKKDLSKLDKNDPLYDRLLLTAERIVGISDSLIKVAELSDPIGTKLEEKTLPNGLSLKKVRVPLGVIAVIYEARPNVTIDVFGLTFKAGNACVLKGSSSAEHSNTALVNIIKSTLEKHELSKDIVCLLNLDREETGEMLRADEYIDVIIPRGGKGLIDFVRKNSSIPTIETGAGVVHTYFAESGDLNKGIEIVNNSKTRRVSVCNALDTLIINKHRLNDLPALTEKLKKAKVEIYADPDSHLALSGSYPKELLHKATKEHFGTEFLSKKMSIKTVANLNEATAHISEFSSKHSEAIIAEDKYEIDQFLKIVDAAAVYANTSTAFTDGGEFGLGAEIGISTQKLHARGPMGLNELTSYKWVVIGDGQIRGKS